MKVEYILTDREKDFLHKLETSYIKYGYNYSMSFDGFRKEWKEEIDTFIKNKLLEYDKNAYYITYRLNETGLSLYNLL